MPQPPCKRVDLPPVDPATLEEAARRFISAKKPPGGWTGEPPKPSND